MKRRNLIQNIAVGIAALGVLKAEEEPPQLAAAGVNLADAGSMRHVANPRVELFAAMEEPYPFDEGQPNGVRLVIFLSGGDTTLYAQAGLHCLGWLDELIGPRAVRIAFEDLLRGSTVILPEAYAPPEDAPSGGAELKLAEGARLLTLSMGAHCFGVLRGQLLRRFIDALRYRIEDMRA